MKVPNKRQLRRSLVKVLPAVGSDRPGMGVFTPATHIITVAHVLPKLPDPEVHAQLDRGTEDRVVLPCFPFEQPVEALDFSVLSVDPCNDIAVLGLEDKWNNPGVERWTRFSTNLQPPQLRFEAFKKGEELRVHIFTHLGVWLTAYAKIENPTAPTVLIALRPRSARVIPGTSGSPAFDEQGRVVGIVNKADPDNPIAQLALLATALPRWVQLEERAEQVKTARKSQ